MNRLIGWVVLWIGLMLTVVSGHHATGYFVQGPELAAIQGGAPAPAPAPAKNGQCAGLSCNCFQFCFYNFNTNSCQTWVNPANGGTTQYVCCQPTNPNNPNKNCVTTLNTANCGALTSTAANPPPFGGGGPVGPCQDNNGNWICINAAGGEPGCTTYFTVDQAKSDGC